MIRKPFMAFSSLFPEHRATGARFLGGYYYETKGLRELEFERVCCPRHLKTTWNKFGKGWIKRSSQPELISVCWSNLERLSSFNITRSGRVNRFLSQNLCVKDKYRERREEKDKYKIKYNIYLFNWKDPRICRQLFRILLYFNYSPYDRYLQYSNGYRHAYRLFHISYIT